jgi:HPt (histidine-containing phosphotransfer) domain-containing protein
MRERTSSHLLEDAVESLDQLETLLAAGRPPDAEHFLRLASKVGERARAAEAWTIADVAGRLEDAARSLSSRDLAWSEDLRALSRRTVADLGLLIRAVGRWERDDDIRVRLAIRRWTDHADDHLEGEMHPIPISELFFDDAGPHIFGAPGGDGGIVDIESLLLRGDAALEAALALRPRIRLALAGQDGSSFSSPVESLIDEVFDLVELARRDAPPEV